MSDEALAAALPGRPEYTVKRYIQLVEALRDKADALTSSSGQRRSKATPRWCTQPARNVTAAVMQFGWITLTFSWFTSSIILLCACVIAMSFAAMWSGSKQQLQHNSPFAGKVSTSPTHFGSNGNSGYKAMALQKAGLQVV